MGSFSDPALILPGAVSNIEVSATAAIAGTKLESGWQKNTASGIAGLDANSRLAVAQLSQAAFWMYWNADWATKADVQGTWAQTDQTSQSVFDPDLTGTEEILQTTTGADGNEMKWSNIKMPAGSYQIIVSYYRGANSGILEVLHGTTSIGTVDLYVASPDYDRTSTLTYTPAANKTADLRMKISGKNASSAGYFGNVGKIEIKRIS